MYKGFVSRLSKRINSYLNEIESMYNFDLGNEFEIVLCRILRDLLPTKYGICRGFLVDQMGNSAGDDIIIYDRLRFPTLRFLDQDDFTRKEYIPIEAVYMYIEAKHNLVFAGKEENINKDNITSLKSIKQIEKTKGLLETRESRPLKHIMETCSVELQPKRDEGWPKIWNPPYCAIISRKVSVDSKEIDKEQIFNILKQWPEIQRETHLLPDLIVAGPDILLIPYLDKLISSGKKSLVPFLFSKEIKPVICKTHDGESLAVGLSHILWALSHIHLENMPFEKILFSSLLNT